MTITVPAPLAAAFAERATVSASELCKLLPMDRKTLLRHVRSGHIEYVKLGVGDLAARRHFTLASVLRFMRERSCTECPSTKGRARRSGAMTSGEEESGFLAQRARRIAERQKRRSGVEAPATSFRERREQRIAEQQRLDKAARLMKVR